MSRPLQVCIDARLIGGRSGGMEQFVIGLVDAISRFEDGDEQYHVLGYPRSHDWIAPYVRGPCRLMLGTGVLPPPQWKTFLKAQGPIVELGQYAGGWLARKSVTLSTSDGTIERAGIDVMHFTVQRAFFTGVPSIYHPHDLLYAHLPELFLARERVKRDVMLRSFCRQAAMVSVTSTWVKNDVAREYGLAPEKIHIVPLTGALGAYPTPTQSDLEHVRRTFDLPEAYALYPAQIWPHKNHLALLEAIALLRDRHGLVVPIVCSGHQHGHYEVVRRRVGELGLERQARFVGFVSPLELTSLYRMSRCVVIPTLFEAASAPLNEAFMAGVAAACSNVTSLPEQAQDAALVFDPRDRESIAKAVQSLWIDAALRQRLIDRGKVRVARFTWERAAKRFRVLYRLLGRRPLSADDAEILSSPPGI